MWGILLWITLAAPQLPGHGAYYPPDDCILLQRSQQVSLLWNMPGRKFQLDLYPPGGPSQRYELNEKSFSVQAQAEQTYGWSVRPLGSKRPAPIHRFTLSQNFTYQADGRHGGRGMAGGNGRNLRLVLERDWAGMHLWLHDRDLTRHYLCLEPEERFLVSVRGGNGGHGASGEGKYNSSIRAAGQAGGSAGWGGTVRITTRSAPWRNYVTVDSSPGLPGPGGGGADYRSGDEILRGEDGAPGRPGQPGSVITTIDVTP
jgi:hypothetical protein